MARIDPRFIDTKYLGEEPNIIAITRENQSQLGRAFNWYNYFYSKKEGQIWTLEYLKRRQYPKDVISKVKSYGEISMTACILCRLENNNTVLNERANSFIAEELDKAIKAKVIEVEEVKETTVRVSIQDRIREKVGVVISELENHFDDFIATQFKHQVNIASLLKENDLKGPQGKMVAEHFKKHQNEYAEALEGKCPQLKEAYGHYKKTDLNKIIKFLQTIIEESTYHSQVSKAVRKPRVKKTKSAIQLVSKVKYLKTFADLNLTSVDPSQIVGATSLWVYNTKYRKLGVYYSIDERGFSIKGTTIQNFNEASSISKTLRKPDQQIKDLMNAGKVKLKQVMTGINSKPSNLNGRLNEETVLLRVGK